MKQWSLVAILSTAFASAATLSLAAAPDAKPQHPLRASLQEQLGLTAEQKSELSRLRVEFRKEQVTRRAETQVARIELRELMRAPQLDEKAIAAKAKVLSDLVAAQTRARIEHQLAMAKVLTSEQRQKAQGFMFEGHERGQWRHGRGEGHGFGRGHGMGRWQHAPGQNPGDVAED